MTVGSIVPMNDEADSLLQRPSNETTSQLPSIPNACRRNGFGILVVVLLTSLNLANTILGYSLQKKEHMDPLFLIYFNVCWDVIGLVIAATLQQDADSPSPPATTNSPSRLRIVSLFMMLLFQVGNWLYFKGIAATGVSISTVIYQSSTVFVFLFSLLFLKEEVTPYSVVSVLFCLGGVVVVALDNWKSETISETLGILALLASAMLWALYEVFLGVAFPKSTQHTVSMFVGWRGLWNLLLGWPLVVVTAWMNPAAWLDLQHLSGNGVLHLCGMAGISVLTTILLTFGISWTSPVYMRLGATLISPASIGWDLYNGYHPGWKCYFGSGMTVVGFVFVNMKWDRSVYCGTGEDVLDGCIWKSSGRFKPTWLRVSDKEVEDDSGTAAALPTRALLPTSRSQ